MKSYCPAPGYPIYSAIINKLGARTRYYHLDQKTNWQPSLDEIRSLINERTRAIILINPSNPTGAITPDETTKRLLELAAEHDLLVISDEVYRDLCFEDSTHVCFSACRRFRCDGGSARESFKNTHAFRLARRLDASHSRGAHA